MAESTVLHRVNTLRPGAEINWPACYLQDPKALLDYARNDNTTRVVIGWRLFSFRSASDRDRYDTV